jgi:coenzyme PQQ precursor peptide PqqA
MVSHASEVRRQAGLLAHCLRCSTSPIHKIHENHEPAIHDFAMRHLNPLSRINTVPADGLPVQQTAASGLTTQENEMTWEKPTAIDFRFGFEITMYIANR